MINNVKIYNISCLYNVEQSNWCCCSYKYFVELSVRGFLVSSYKLNMKKKLLLIAMLRLHFNYYVEVLDILHSNILEICKLWTLKLTESFQWTCRLLLTSSLYFSFDLLRCFSSN